MLACGGNVNENADVSEAGAVRVILPAHPTRAIAPMADAGLEAEAPPVASEWDGAALNLMDDCDPGRPHCGSFGGVGMICECSFTQPGCVCTFDCAEAGTGVCPYATDAGGAACSPFCVPNQ